MNTPRTNVAAYNGHKYLLAECAAIEQENQRLREALETLTAVIGLTPIKGNLAALQEAFDLARTALSATPNP